MHVRMASHETGLCYAECNLESLKLASTHCTLRNIELLCYTRYYYSYKSRVGMFIKALSSTLDLLLTMKAIVAKLRAASFPILAE